MKSFAYASPTTEGEALSLLSEPGEIEILAGGTDLVGLMKKMIITPDLVVNILDIPSLKTIEQLDGGAIAIGAAVTLDEILAHPYLDPYPAIGQAIQGISSMQLQCQGTIGGEVMQRPQCWYFRGGRGLLAGSGSAVEDGDSRYHAIFANDGPAKFVSASRIAPALIALHATARIVGPVATGGSPVGFSGEDASERYIPVEQLFRVPRHEGERENILARGQFLTHFVLPDRRNFASATYEVRQGEGPDFPLASAAASLRIEDGIVREAGIILGQVAPTPWISDEASRAIVGKPVNAETAEAAGFAAVASANPLAHNSYKVQLAKTAVKRAILRAAGLETGGF
ncbi:MAG: FAD binding domain-containing protein [Pirellulaceae bacterium]